MMARVMFRVFDRERRVDEHVKDKVDIEIGALRAYGRHSVRRLCAVTTIGLDVGADELAEATDRMCAHLGGCTDPHGSHTTMLANGWVLHVRLDQRGAGNHDQPMLPLVIDYDRAA